MCSQGALHTLAATGELQGSEERKCVVTLSSNCSLESAVAVYNGIGAFTELLMDGICVTHGVHEATEHVLFIHS